MSDPYYRTFQKQIACKPPKEAATTMKKVGGLVIIDEKLSLLELEVLFDSDTFEAGDKIYVHGGQAKNHQWYSAVFSVGETEFILVPEDFILLASSTP